ncbi:LuxR C-terminal-related transcriptional regulator [Micromonospora sp. NPDC002575]|uniref:helix-turn-helix transcriptional regulator n=1 Tax=Micromonospora sp. NPDC002575 TaxID=3364222 RepID=UPI0036A5BCE2
MVVRRRVHGRQAHQITVAALADITAARPNVSDLFGQCTELLRDVLGFDAACWHLNDPVTGLITTIHSEGLDPRGFAQAALLEFGCDDVATFAKIRSSGQSADTLSNATRGHVAQSIRYREQLQPAGFGDELRANFDAQGGRWGCAAFMRAADRGPYTPNELRVARQVSRQLGVALRDLHHPAPGPDLDAELFPAAAVLGPRDELLAADPAAEALITELNADQSKLGVPASFLVVAGRARRMQVARVRVRSRRGTWLVVHASLLDGRADGRICVVATPASPAEVIPVALFGYGLTPREQEVALHVVRGRSTNDIARVLSLTNLTVQDHLKTIFAKTSVRSRRELVAQLFAATPPETW